MYCLKGSWRIDTEKNAGQFEDLKDFVKCYNAGDIINREETWTEVNQEGRWRKFSYDEIITRDKTNLDILWLKDRHTIDLENLPHPDELINEIIDNMESAIQSFKSIRDNLN